MTLDMLVCLDRDGTLVEDEDYYLGSQEDWRSLVKLRSGVVEGLSLLQDAGAYLVVTTAQSGVALADERFSALTEERVEAVNAYVDSLLRERGVEVDGWLFCPYVDAAYAARPDRSVREAYVRDGHSWIKPRTGMAEAAAARVGVSLDQAALFVVGDRRSDVEMALRAGGEGVLVPSWKTSSEDRAYVAGSEKASVAADFLLASEWVVQRVQDA